VRTWGRNTEGVILHPSFGFLAFRIWPSSVCDLLVPSLLASGDNEVAPLEAASAMANAPRRKSGVLAIDTDHVLGELDGEQDARKVQI
jgi:hypothetical protein